MSKFIHKIKQKPEEQRKQIVLFVMVILMSLVVLVWLSTLGVKDKKQKKVEEDTGPSPFTMLVKSFSETYDGIKDSVSDANLGEVKENLLESSGGQEVEESGPDMDRIEENLFQ